MKSDLVLIASVTAFATEKPCGVTFDPDTFQVHGDDALSEDLGDRVAEWVKKNVVEAQELLRKSDDVLSSASRSDLGDVHEVGTNV